MVAESAAGGVRQWVTDVSHNCWLCKPISITTINWSCIIINHYDYHPDYQYHSDNHSLGDWLEAGVVAPCLQLTVRRMATITPAQSLTHWVNERLPNSDLVNCIRDWLSECAASEFATPWQSSSATNRNGRGHIYIDLFGQDCNVTTELLPHWCIITSPDDLAICGTLY